MILRPNAIFSAMVIEKVNQFDDEYPDLKNVAAICVYPNFAAIVKNTLEVDGVNIACVSGGFPSSQTFIEVKVAETALASEKRYPGLVFSEIDFHTAKARQHAYVAEVDVNKYSYIPRLQNCSHIVSTNSTFVFLSNFERSTARFIVSSLLALKTI